MGETIQEVIGKMSKERQDKINTRADELIHQEEKLRVLAGKLSTEDFTVNHPEYAQEWLETHHDEIAEAFGYVTHKRHYERCKELIRASNREMEEKREWKNRFLNLMTHLKFKNEHTAFENFANSQELDMRMHPLHYLFLDKKTDFARSVWKSCLNYVWSVMEKDNG